MKKRIISDIISFLLVLLFVYAALSKLFNYQEFKVQLKSSPLLKDSAAILAIVLPLIELITAAMLVITQTKQTGFFLSFILMTLFTLYIAGMLLLSKHLPCSCGGILREMTWKQHLIFNAFFTIIAFTGIKLESKIKLLQGDAQLSA